VLRTREKSTTKRSEGGEGRKKGNVREKRTRGTEGFPKKAKGSSHVWDRGERGGSEISEDGRGREKIVASEGNANGSAGEGGGSAQAEKGEK